MKTIIITLATLMSLSSFANSMEGLTGTYKQQSTIKLKTGKKIKTLNATNTVLIEQIDENSARVRLNIIGDQASTCALDEEFMKNGPTWVFTKNSQTGRGTCEITVSDFRGKGIILFENKDTGECVDFCSPKATIGVRLFDKAK